MALTIRLIRQYNPIADQWNQRMGRVCECGQMYGGLQITPLSIQDDPDDYDW